MLNEYFVSFGARTKVALHVIGWLIKITNARDMILAGLTDDVAVVTNNNSGIPDSVAVGLVSLKDRRD